MSRLVRRVARDALRPARAVALVGRAARAPLALRALSTSAAGTAEPFASSSTSAGSDAGFGSSGADGGGHTDPKPAIMDAALKHVAREG
jgi:hypothetical protein